MKKQEYYDALIEAGYTKEDLKGKTKDVLVRLYDDHLEGQPKQEAPKPKVKKDELTIVSKRKDRFILEDGSEVLFKEVPHLIKPGYLSPFLKAKDKLKKEAGKWIAVSLLLMFSTGCIVHGPYTQSRYEIGYKEEIGVFMSMKLFDSDTVTELAVDGYNWVAGDDEEEVDKEKKED
jgi:hypothetical protein